jgi:hypothetical protein
MSEPVKFLPPAPPVVRRTISVDEATHVAVARLAGRLAAASGKPVGLAFAVSIAARVTQRLLAENLTDDELKEIME